MPTHPYFFGSPLITRWRPFEFDGSIDANKISGFAKMQPLIRVIVKATYSMPNGDYSIKGIPYDEGVAEYVIARFNMNSTLASFAPPGMFPGDETPDLFCGEIFDQNAHPICVSFRSGDGGPDLAVLFFNKREGKIEGRIQESDHPLLLPIHSLVDGIQPVAPDVRP